jgi:3-hydroxyisobutyryl-CoA hydrolase
VLVDKMKGRPAWSPPTLSEVSEEYVLTNFFSQKSPYFLPEPKLDIPQSLPEPKNPMRYSLPTEEEVRHYIVQDTPSSGGLAVSRNQVLRYFEEKTLGKGGVREKVSDILDRKCQLEKGAAAGHLWLRWKH